MGVHLNRISLEPISLRRLSRKSGLRPGSPDGARYWLATYDPLEDDVLHYSPPRPRRHRLPRRQQRAQFIVGSPPTNGLPIASLVLGIVWIYWIGSVLALVFGYIAKSQIDRSSGHQGGRGLAIAGIVLGSIGVVVLAISRDHQFFSLS